LTCYREILRISYNTLTTNTPFLPNNVADLTVPDILFDLCYRCLLHWLYLHFTRNFNLWQKLGIPYVKPTPFVGNLKDCALQKTTIGEQLQKIYNEQSDKPYVGIFSFDKHSLLIRDVELVKNILVRDFQTFMDRTLAFEDKFDPLFGNIMVALKGQLLYHFRTKLTSVFTSRKLKMMFYVVDTSGKEVAECLKKATADGKLSQDQYCYKLHCKIKRQKLKKF